MLFNRTNSLLVCVQSSWFVGEADIARIVLREHGIPCHVENEHFHMWQWLYASISGGFKVLVPRQQAEEAVRILESGKNGTPSASQEQPWQCTECGWSVDGDWDVCWYCETSRDGVPRESSSETPACDQSSESENVADEQDRAQILAVAVVLPLAILFWATKGSIGAVVFGAAAALIAHCLISKKRPPMVEPPAEDLLEAERRAMAEPPTPAEQSARRRLKMGNRVVERALMSAMFGVFWFPPLAILAFVLLLRLDLKKTPPGPRQRQQMGLAWILCAFGLILIPIFAFAVTVSAIDAVGLMGDWR